MLQIGNTLEVRLNKFRKEHITMPQDIHIHMHIHIHIHILHIDLHIHMHTDTHTHIYIYTNIGLGLSCVRFHSHCLMNPRCLLQIHHGTLELHIGLALHGPLPKSQANGVPLNNLLSNNDINSYRIIFGQFHKKPPSRMTVIQMEIMTCVKRRLSFATLLIPGWCDDVNARSNMIFLPRLLSRFHCIIMHKNSWQGTTFSH